MQHASSELRRKAEPFLSGKRETYATVLLGIMLQVYGAECLNWDPLTVEAQIRDDFSVDMPDQVYDQLMAIMNVMSNDTVYTSASTFDHTVAYLCGVDNTDQDMPSPHELAWACFEIMVNDPDPYDQGPEAPPPFCPDIQAYCGVVLSDAGMKRKPQALEFARMPKWVPSDLKEDPAMFNAATGSASELASDVDRFVEEQLETLISHLADIGLSPAPLLLEEKRDLPVADPLDAILPS